jgi:cell division transport system permease protein
MFREFLMFWMRETSSNIARNRVMSLLAVSTATVGLFILGAFFLAFINLQAVVGKQTQKLDIVVFLKKDISDKRRKEIYNAARVQQVADLQFVSRSQVLKEQATKNPDIPMNDFQGEFNPYDDELRIKLKPEYLDDMLKLQSYLNSIDGVIPIEQSRIQTERAPVERLLALRRFVAIAGVAALLMLGMAILLIIHNAIRLTVFSRRREMRIMELVGATSWFIRIPFLMEGLFYGLAGAVLASVILMPIYSALTRVQWPLIQELLPLPAALLLRDCAGLMLLTGLLFGIVGSWLSLTKATGRGEKIA